MRRLIDWFVDNPVAANLLMVLVLVGGLMTLPRIKEELFPEVTPPFVTVAVAYPGAAPEEIEDGITIRVEEAVHDIEGVKQVTSVSSESLAAITLELETDVDPDAVVDEVKARVDAIEQFPEEAEKPIIRKVDMQPHVINVVVHGDASESALKRVAERVRDELTALPEASKVTLANARRDEISIEVSEDALRRHGLTFEEVAAAVRGFSVDLPGGTLKTEGGEIRLRSKGRAETAAEFGALPLRTLPDGSRLLLRDVARVVDGFEDADVRSRFDGRRAMILQVFRSEGQGVLDVARAVRAYVERERARLPEVVRIDTYADNSRILEGRMDLLIRNARLGLMLVFLLLILFFRLRLAFWVGVGMALAFLGAIWLMPALDVSVNLISLFAFIVVLGILVDDAIVVGENIYRHNESGLPSMEAAKVGAREIALPVVLAVGTTIAAFAPMLGIPGVMGDFASVIPKVVILCLVFSLVEALLILPSHLSHLRTRGAAGGPITRMWGSVQDRLSGLLDGFIRRLYLPALRGSVRWRYLTLASGAALLLLTMGLFAGRYMKFTFFPAVESDYVAAFVTMPEGAPSWETDRIIRHLEEAAEKVRKEIEDGRAERIYRHVAASVGTQPFREQQTRNSGAVAREGGAGNLGEVLIELAPSEDRPDVSSTWIVRRWRELAGSVPDAEELSFTSDLMSQGAPIDIRVSAGDLDRLRAAAAALKGKLQEYPGVFDVSDTFRAGKKETRLVLKPSGEALGLTQAHLARQVRQAYYGEEAQRIQRRREDVKVMVRYPEEQRRSMGDVEEMRLRLPGGVEAPFSAVAEIRPGRGPSAIRRADRRRSIDVTADVDPAQANANEVLADLMGTFMPALAEEHPGLRYSLEGQQQQQAETMEGVRRGLIIALIVIYAMLAVPFRSYAQPALIMLAIPFGVAGAIWAHFFLGMDLTFLSLIGIMALSGVVVNDSLILIDFVNRARREGADAEEALLRAGPIRFRPILMTSLTTFAGLTPMLLERSMQAKFLIPMAVSLAYGVMFSTVIILLIIPAAYMALEDVKGALSRLSRRRAVEEAAADARAG
ncbi:MAG: efflux RND transporter permease subunit [Planctomycetes bacterium]|nr:efflux RND transporter permease subunit [Planctomycetota bacterium]